MVVLPSENVSHCQNGDGGKVPLPAPFFIGGHSTRSNKLKMPRPFFGRLTKRGRSERCEELNSAGSVPLGVALPKSNERSLSV